MGVKSNLAEEREQAEPPLLDSLIGYRLRRASNRMTSDFLVTVSPLALRPALFAMLEGIRTTPGIIQMALGTELGIQRANLVPLINELTGRGLVARRAAPNDRRALSLFLTAKGEELLDRAEKMVLEHEERTLAKLSKTERAKLLELLSKVATDVDA